MLFYPDELCFYAPSARLAFYGNIQPSIVKDCFGKQTKLSGFFQRWCFFASEVTKLIRKFFLAPAVGLEPTTL